MKSAGEIFLSGLRGATNFSNMFRIVFRIFFHVFQTVFRIDLKVFRGQFRSADVPPQYFMSVGNHFITNGNFWGVLPLLEASTSLGKGKWRGEGIQVSGPWSLIVKRSRSK